MPQRVTLRDVATYAGVSVTTVSNVVRDWPYVSDDTRLKVQQAIHQLGYSPHPIAQGLRTGQTQVIGFVVPDLSNPYFASMVSVAEDMAQECGYSLLVFNTHEDEAREADCIHRATQRWVDGLLIAQVAEAQHTADVLRSINIPVVAIDRIPAGFTGASCKLDNFQAAQLATRHLYELGHRRIAHLAGPLSAQPAHERLDGYKSALAEYRLPYQRVTIEDGHWRCAEGYRAMQEILADDVLPTAVFASNDRMAICAMHAILEHGLSIAVDISIVGVDDLEVSEYLNPPLTTVRQPIEAMAQAGIDLLLKLLDDETPDNLHPLLSPTLIQRQSTAPPREGV
jgi:LacI family transcriptional regulator